jgi:heme-degrading monooxygenase HmoA
MELSSVDNGNKCYRFKGRFIVIHHHNNPSLALEVQAVARTEIRKDAPLATEITFLHCAVEKQDAVVMAAIQYVRQLATQKLFIGSNVLRSTDGSRVMLYSQWSNDQAADAAREALGESGWVGLVETDSGGPRLYDVVYADDRSAEGVSVIGPAETDVIFVNEIRTMSERQDRLLELVIANNEESSFSTPGYRSANFHKSRDGERAVNYSLWDTEDHLIDAISDMATVDINLEETIAIANPDFRFYVLVYSHTSHSASHRPLS